MLDMGVFVSQDELLYHTFQFYPRTLLVAHLDICNELSTIDLWGAPLAKLALSEVLYIGMLIN